MLCQYYGRRTLKQGNTGASFDHLHEAGPTFLRQQEGNSIESDGVRMARPTFKWWTMMAIDSMIYRAFIMIK